MQGRDFLDLARDILSGTATEAHWRGAAGRAYYALMLECREAILRWGITIPPRDNVHTFVRLRFVFAADPDIKAIGRLLDRLGHLRNKADYVLSHHFFTSDAMSKNAVDDAADHIDLLDANDSDPARRAAAVAAIQKAFP